MKMIELIFYGRKGQSHGQSGYWEILVRWWWWEIHLWRLACQTIIVNDKGLKLNSCLFWLSWGIKKLLGHGLKYSIILFRCGDGTDDSGFEVAKIMPSRNGLEDQDNCALVSGIFSEEHYKRLWYHDYKTRKSFKPKAIVTTIIASLRSIKQILSINQSRLGLQKK